MPEPSRDRARRNSPPLTSWRFKIVIWWWGLAMEPSVFMIFSSELLLGLRIWILVRSPVWVSPRWGTIIPKFWRKKMMMKAHSYALTLLSLIWKPVLPC
jgi:hypothetical protein